jgi:hypothetical protein
MCALWACSGIFDPFGFAKGDFKELQTKEIKNGAMRHIPIACQRFLLTSSGCCRSSCGLALIHGSHACLLQHTQARQGRSRL